jgi:hypothetical protein
MSTPHEPNPIAHLRAKYEEMRALRRADADGAAFDRARAARLAARFPGALREIDTLPMEELERRLAAVETAVAEPNKAEPWMHAMARFHELLGGALVAKRWLAGRKAVDGELRGTFEARFAGRREVLAWSDALPAVARPPSGRLLRLVLSRVAQETQTSEEDLRAALFGPPRRR